LIFVKNFFGHNKLFVANKTHLGVTAPEFNPWLRDSCLISIRGKDIRFAATHYAKQTCPPNCKRESDWKLFDLEPNLILASKNLKLKMDATKFMSKQHCRNFVKNSWKRFQRRLRIFVLKPVSPYFGLFIFSDWQSSLHQTTKPRLRSRTSRWTLLRWTFPESVLEAAKHIYRLLLVALLR